MLSRPRRSWHSWRLLLVLVGLMGTVLAVGSVVLVLDLQEAVQEHHEHPAVSPDRALVEETRRLVLWLLAALIGGGVALVVAASVVVRVDRVREEALDELRIANDDLSFYSRVIEASDSALAVTDETGAIVWVNEAFERIAGWPLARLRGLRAQDYLRRFPGNDAGAIAQMEEALSLGERLQQEVTITGPDGRETWLDLAASPLQDGAGRVEGYFAVLSDITERHELAQLQAAARHAAELAARQKATFLATMSHEIRTPLNAVLGLTDLLLLTDLDEEQRDYVTTTHRSGSHLLALINDVLDYSALESGRMAFADEAFSMRDLLAETVAMFAATADQRDLQLSLDCADDLPPMLRGDVTRIRQVLVNLVGNALKFTVEGVVVLRCRAARLPDGRWDVVTTVLDTGIGIAADQIPHLFTSFARGDASTTRERGGTGLGLAISRKLVEAMGGRIELASEVGQGTRVAVRLVHEMAGVPEPRTRAPRARVDPRLRVLVVEDDLVNRKVVTRMLDRLEMEPDIAVNGEEAVAAAAAGAYDVVLMDLEMPVMDGLQAARLLRERLGEHTPWLVALTANALVGDRERFLAAGLDDYLPKPVTLDALAEVLSRVPQHEEARPA